MDRARWQWHLGRRRAGTRVRDAIQQQRELQRIKQTIAPERIRILRWKARGSLLAKGQQEGRQRLLRFVLGFACIVREFLSEVITGQGIVGAWLFRPLVIGGGNEGIQADKTTVIEGICQLGHLWDEHQRQALVVACPRQGCVSLT